MTQLSFTSHFKFAYNYSSNSYEFDTDDGIKYIITLLDYSQVMDVSFQVYSFIIDRFPENSRSKDPDNKIRNTILLILSNFFENEQSALIAIYDSIDGRQKFRKKLFDKWFDEFNNGIVKRKEGKFKTKDEETFAIAIYSSGHEFSKEIETQFNILIENDFFN